MRILLAIGTGSFIGGTLRYLLSQFLQERALHSFPVGTFTVNILGCLAIGIVFGFSDRGILGQEARMFLATGLLGGFTTFSAFSNESFMMLRDGQYTYAFLYIAGSLLIGIAATFLGYSLVKML
ncbi:MAG TPA: fluoride efflux transporter CrcB [Bacteroidales bacterium]|nr:fluoride efflux transporter CrcB [Bacteroidales bacterium]HPS62693.1 fluoride efflux transporter CrcB [Bacteroidales bacterium]